MKCRKPFYSSIIMILLISFLPNLIVVNAEANKPNLNIYQSENNVKAEWAVDILPNDILYSSGFEDTDELPRLDYGDTPRGNGGQSFTSEDKYEGKKSIIIEDTFKNGNQYTGRDLNGNIVGYKNSSYFYFPERKYIESGMDLSISMKAKSIGQSIIQPRGVGGNSEYGVSFGPKFTKDAKVGDKIINVSNPSIFKNQISIVINDNPLKVSSPENVNIEKGEVTLRTPLQKSFKSGDDVLRLISVVPVEFGSRSLVNSEWSLLNFNSKVEDLPYYDVFKKGLMLYISSTSSNKLYIDDLKMGYATQTELYRDGSKIYEGKLADFNDMSAIDKESPDKVENYTIYKDKEETILRINQPNDNGTSYIYQLKAVSNDGKGEYYSNKEKINVISGFKGYSVSFSNSYNEDTPNYVNFESNNIKIPDNKRYIHISSIDNEGNKSEKTTIDRENIDNLFKVKEEGSNNKWTKDSITMKILVDSKYKLKEVVFPNNQIKKQNVEVIDYTFSDNGIYKFKIKDIKGNEYVHEIIINKIDKAPPELKLSQESSDKWTNKDVIIHIDAKDSQSGIKKLMYIGEDMVENGNFKEGLKSWQIFSGEIKLINGEIELGKSNNENRTRLRQLNMFKESVTGATYYSEINAKGEGILNTRFAFGSHADGGNYVEDYSKRVNNKNNYETYEFLLDRKEFSHDHLVVEKIGEGTIYINNVKVFAQKEITDNQLIVKENGVYRIVAEDNAGNITIESIEISNIDKNVPQIEVKQQNASEWTNESVDLNVSTVDKESGLKEIFVTGEDQVKNGDFREGARHWVGGNGEDPLTFKNGNIILNNRVARDKLNQLLFFDEIDKSTHYAEVTARGKGILNARRGVNGPVQTDYSVNVDSDEFSTYSFVINKMESSNASLVIERIGTQGWLEIKEVKVYEKRDLKENDILRVHKNGLYTFFAEDNAGNVSSKTHRVSNIDTDKPEVQITQNTNKDTHENIILNIEANDSLSGIKSIIYLGDNMIKNGDFSEGSKHWNTNVLLGGNARVENGIAYLDDKDSPNNKIGQDKAFVGSSVGEKYFAKVSARGAGIINSRYLTDNSMRPSDTNNQQEIISEKEFKEYSFPIIRHEKSIDDFIIERRTQEGYIEINNVEVYAQNDITDTKKLEVTRNGEYMFMIEDYAGNITISNHTVDNIVRELTFNIPIVKQELELTIGDENVYEVNLEPIEITDWRDEVPNDWALSVSASNLTSDNYEFPSNSLLIENIESIYYLNENIIDDFSIVPGFIDNNSSIEIVRAENKKGIYKVNFKKGALKINIPNTIKKGSYKSTITWQMESSPKIK